MVRSRIERWAQVAGLVATAWLVWATSIAPHRGFRIGPALWIAFCALAWSAAIAGMLWLVMRRLHDEEALPLSMSAAAAVWFAPATLLLSQFSLPALAAGLVLIISAARLLCTPSSTGDTAAPQSVPRVARMISETEAPVDPLSRHFLPALGISAALEAAAFTFWMGRPAEAVALFALSMAMLTAVAIGLGAWVADRQPNLPRSILGLVLTFLLAMMVGPGTGGWGWGFGWGSASGGDQVVASGPTLVRRPEKSSQAATNLPGNYPGVILWPEIKPVVTLVAPRPSRGGGMATQSKPLTIPFDGEYWMFRWPYQRPPRNSHFRRGTPSALSFSTPDHFPMEMEARQKLDQAVSMRCCRILQLAVLNADPSPRISLELILIDRKSRASAMQSLGRASVTSLPNSKVEVPEILNFAFPAAPQFDQFDEIRVVFHRNSRVDRSARVSIERFVLIPQGHL